ncbi:MAG: bifunctional hydroxymethylpyrimidine kinase/phosphomethylpyrimidine kinase [Massilibacteroides sp.]|nr:bifunctional hydroxymethylpyrimidine kinase/phosphomethylpyrimidine kinase [Massilibacteroides sp.]
MKHYKKILTIAGSDSGAGAGIQADIKTISACGGYAMSAITAITAQNTLGIKKIFAVPEEIIVCQIEAILSDMGADAIKIGMLHSSELIWAVIETLIRYKATNIILDPVMVSSSGDRLLNENAIYILREELLPLVHLITPNIPEAEILLGKSITSADQLEDAAHELSFNGKVSVLLKSGHLKTDDTTDILYDVNTKKITKIPGKRIITNNAHGTGCTLSSAIATYIAQGYPMLEAVQKAKLYLTKALQASVDFKIGKGNGPLNHFFSLAEENEMEL